MADGHRDARAAGDAKTARDPRSGGGGGSLTFDVVEPARGDDACREDHAWPVATFAPGTFRRVA